MIISALCRDLSAYVMISVHGMTAAAPSGRIAAMWTSAAPTADRTPAGGQGARLTTSPAPHPVGGGGGGPNLGGGPGACLNTAAAPRTVSGGGGGPDPGSGPGAVGGGGGRPDPGG